METDRCTVCGQALRLAGNPWEQDQPIASGKGIEVCPECYRNMSWEEKKQFLGS